MRRKEMGEMGDGRLEGNGGVSEGRIEQWVGKGRREKKGNAKDEGVRRGEKRCVKMKIKTKETREKGKLGIRYEVEGK